MKKRMKRISKKNDRSLPSLIEEFAQLLRERVRLQEKNTSSQIRPSAAMSNVVEQIAVLLRKETHKKNKPKRSAKKTAPQKRRSTKSIKK